jgi:hypothetical protein
MNVILLDWLTLQRGPAEGEEHHEQINERYTSLGSWCSLWSRGRQQPGDDTHTNGATNTCEKHELCTYGVSVIMRIHQCWDTYLSSSNAINDRSTGQSTNETRYTGGKDLPVHEVERQDPVLRFDTRLRQQNSQEVCSVKRGMSDGELLPQSCLLTCDQTIPRQLSVN